MTRILIAVALASLAFPAQAQKSYKCLDAKGVTQYTQTPSTVCKDKPVEIKAPQPAPAGAPQSTGKAATGKPPGKPSTATPASVKQHDDIDSEGALRAKTRDPKRPH